MTNMANKEARKKRKMIKEVLNLNLSHKYQHFGFQKASLPIFPNFQLLELHPKANRLFDFCLLFQYIFQKSNILEWYKICNLNKNPY